MGGQGNGKKKRKTESLYLNTKSNREVRLEARVASPCDVVLAVTFVLITLLSKILPLGLLLLLLELGLLGPGLLQLLRRRTLLQPQSKEMTP